MKAQSYTDAEHQTCWMRPLLHGVIDGVSLIIAPEKYNHFKFETGSQSEQIIVWRHNQTFQWTPFSDWLPVIIPHTEMTLYGWSNPKDNSSQQIPDCNWKSLEKQFTYFALFCLFSLLEASRSIKKMYISTHQTPYACVWVSASGLWDLIEILWEGSPHGSSHSHWS